MVYQGYVGLIEKGTFILYTGAVLEFYNGGTRDSGGHNFKWGHIHGTH